MSWERAKPSFYLFQTLCERHFKPACWRLQEVDFYDDSKMLMMTMMMTMVMASRGSKTMEMIMLVIKDLRKWLKIFLTWQK